MPSPNEARSTANETSVRAEFECFCERVGEEDRCGCRLAYAAGMARMREMASKKAANWMGTQRGLSEAIGKLPAAPGAEGES
jgi:hypothetical protein